MGINQPTQISYRILRKRRKQSVTLSVNVRNEVLISAPANFSDSQAEELLRRQSKWITRRLALNLKNQKKFPPIHYLPGDKIPFLGEYYELALYESPRRKIVMEGKVFQVFAPKGELYETQDDGVAHMVRAWYEAEAEKFLKKRVAFYEPTMQLKSSKLEIKTVGSFWGSCSGSGILRFNARLLMAPLPVIDYVVVHELAHLSHKNHSASFWREVEKVLSDYRERRDWLTQYGAFLTF